MTMSIRTRLLLWVTGGMAVLLTVFAVLVHQALARSLLDGFDRTLLASARAISSAVEQSSAAVRFDLDEHEAPEFYRSVEPDFFQVWLEDGEQLAASPSLPAGGLARFAGPPDDPAFGTVRLPDGRAARTVGLVFAPRADDEAAATGPARHLSLVVARRTASLEPTLGFLRWLLIVTTAGALGSALLLGAVTIRRGLKPLDALAARIAAVREDDLSARIPAGSLPREIAPVAGRLNELLHRLEDAFQRERSFAADAAHELRTPLAGLRCTLEVALSQPRAAEDYREAIADCLDVVRHTQGIVESLLALARLESGQIALRPESVNIRDLINTVWEPLQEQVSSRAIRWHILVPRQATLRTDQDILRMIVAALLANAAEYADARGRIEITGDFDPRAMSLSISNTGCRLAGEDLRHVFDRFWRGDPARSGTGIHCGLGLPLARRAAAALGGSVSVQAEDGVFTVRLEVPASR